MAALRSMTGYARAQRTAGAAAVEVTLKSVNHRFLDLRWQAPAELDGALAGLDKQVRQALARGHVEIRCACAREGGSGRAVLNPEMVEAYLAAHAELGRRLGIPAANIAVPAPAEILRVPGVLAAGATGAVEAETWAELAHGALAEALGEMNRMRETEGAALAVDLRARLAHLQAAAAEIDALRGQIEPSVRQRLELRLQEMLGETALPPERLLQEAALIASRSDISEELTRLDAHLAQARALLAGGGEVGKKLDFLAQELNREANTLLSKTTSASAAGLRAAELGLELKAELEKFREQVQNLE